ncbi:hypothetical protein [Methylobacterium nodulans]|uniref:Uncharacterized protein n=1 Tax=Methylobacterium nodulans (strain LMG 21967 / CNCM I-2342 / ORS 2060) TaxID=460265 RepID=B8IE10_METNO|nr:hypothetical protein [Methylobacterium nodulans]ACL57556.1 hypothetical protein Mnod_2593 [Methylobacterium nodulans ORS 2060]ACL58791.1 hypothetical protein Mnod_3891 [Methylobacterium nodulans ORS 2060]
MEHLIALLPLLSSMPVLQVIVGGLVSVVCVAMVLRANRDKAEAPPPAPGSLADGPLLHFQGPAALLDLQREIRDLLRQGTEAQSRIAECVRIIREESRRQTEILDRIEREQAVQGRANREH